MFTMSPREQVEASVRKIGGGGNMHYYYLPTTARESEPGVQRLFPKNKRISIIEAEAKRKSLNPSPSQYTINYKNNFGDKSLNRSPTNLPKGPRISENAQIELNNKKPERSSPSPMAYSPTRSEKVIGGGGIKT